MDQTNSKKAIVDMATSLSHVFKKYGRNTREEAWDRLTSPAGKNEVRKILQNPNQSLNMFSKLSFKEWLASS